MNQIKNVVAFLTIVISVCVSAEKVVIAADRWCPYNCEPGSLLPGYMVEITRKAFAQENIEVEYRVLPWSRALLYANEGRIAGVIGAVESEVKGLSITDNHLGYTRSVFFTYAESPWQFSTIEALAFEGKKIGVIKDYDYSDEFTEFARLYGRQLYVVVGEDPLPDLVRLLGLKKLDAIIEDEFVFYYMLQKLGHAREAFKSAGATGPTQPLYVAFKNPEHARILDLGILRLRESGEFDAILRKYNLADWARPPGT